MNPSLVAAQKDAATLEGKKVTTCVIRFVDLFREGDAPLALDTYQRPYVWGEDKIQQLLSDLVEHENKQSKELDYYMGTILLHDNREKDRRYIIDGQQRISSLCILHYVKTGHIPKNHDLRYYSQISTQNLLRTLQRFREEPRVDTLPVHLFERICFTVVMVRSEDLAFTFFDTQNNRGVPLYPTDLLKAYHLREIGGTNYELWQTECAKRWEILQQFDQAKGIVPSGQGQDFALTLFRSILWRSRRWTGQRQKFLDDETFDGLLEEFQQRTHSVQDHTIPLYATHNNRRGLTLKLLPESGYQIEPMPVHPTENPKDLPFAIRQPISKGIGFFLYAHKYACLAVSLLDSSPQEQEIPCFQEFYREVVSHTSVYLCELFFLASLMFIDKLGHRKLFEFALRLDHVLGAIRLNNSYIFKQAPVKFLREEPHNLLDVIAGAFRAEEVLHFLTSRPWVDDVYEKERIEKAGVQKQYKQAVLRYFRKTGHLAGKSTWIEEKLHQKGLV